MRIDILTLFPEMFQGPLDASIVARAREQGLVEIALHNIRDWAFDKHRRVDDEPYGGGAGMVMKPEPLFAAVEAVQELAESQAHVVLLTPQGRLLTQEVVEELAGRPRLLLICGRYEGFDERIREHLADDEVSIGDYVLSGGEPAAIVLVDALVRRIPNALGNEASLDEESHTRGLLEYAQYTRPAEFRGWAVPDILLSGNHAEIARWRRQESLRRTFLRRPDLLESAQLSAEDLRFIDELRRSS